ncbi:MAG: hypothetical protein ACFFCW_47335 [Candidatus Hodarchaeota archaeon]
MDVIQVVDTIKRRFAKSGSPADVPLLKGGSFKARLEDEGIFVDNLGNQPFLHWAVFQEAACVLIRNGGRAKRGNAMRARLGAPGLPIDSIEGHIALVVYGKRPGDNVFRRIVPIACILIWAGICEAEPNELVLRNFP